MATDAFTWKPQTPANDMINESAVVNTSYNWFDLLFACYLFNDAIRYNPKGLLIEK